MIRIGSEFIFWSVAFFIVMLIFDGFDIALQSTIFIIGMIYYTYNIAFVYLRLKKSVSILNKPPQRKNGFGSY